MRPSLFKIGAAFKVILVAFAIIPFLTLDVYKLFPRFETWQTEALGFPFPVFGYLAMIHLVLLVILVQREKPTGNRLAFDSRI